MWCENLLVALLSRTNVKVNTVEQLLFPVTLCGWIVGMGIIEYPTGNPWPVASFIYTVVLTAGYGYLVEVNIENMDLLLGARPSDASKFIFKALFYGNVGLYLCGTILGWARIKGVKKIVESLQSSDMRMEKLGIPRDYRLIYVRQLSLLLTQFVVIVVFMCTALMWNSSSGESMGFEFAYSFASYYPVVLTAVGDISYVTLVRYVIFLKLLLLFFQIFVPFFHRILSSGFYGNPIPIPIPHLSLSTRTRPSYTGKKIT